MLSNKHIGYLYEREISDIRYPIYMTPKNQIFFIDETRHKYVQLMMPLFYEMALALSYNNLTIILDWSDTYEEYIANSKKGFPLVKINGTIVKNKISDSPKEYIVVYRDYVATTLLPAFALSLPAKPATPKPEEPPQKDFFALALPATPRPEEPTKDSFAVLLQNYGYLKKMMPIMSFSPPFFIGADKKND